MANFEEFLKRGADILGIELQYDAIQRIKIHRELLLKWAPKVNLTTVLDPKSMAERLYLDSGILLPKISSRKTLHDVGTGAGFPGLVLKALNPKLDVTLTEARRKRVSFLKTVARQMGLHDGLTIRWSRLGWEKGEEKVKNKFWDEVVSRATFPPDLWIEAGKNLLAPGSRLWVMAGQPHAQGDDSLNWKNEADKNHLVLESQEVYHLPFCKKTRWLVSFRRSL